MNSKDKDNITALMEASIMDHRDVVKHLLKVRSSYLRCAHAAVNQFSEAVSLALETLTFSASF